MSQFPPFHPDWLVTFWFATPGFKAMDPHVVISVIAAIGLALFFIKKRKTPPINVVATNFEEEQFHHLLKKKQMIERKMAELKVLWEQDGVASEQVQMKLDEYGKHLDKVNRELLYFT